jgi:hypothetical protein
VSTPSASVMDTRNEELSIPLQFQHIDQHTQLLEVCQVCRQVLHTFISVRLKSGPIIQGLIVLIWIKYCFEYMYLIVLTGPAPGTENELAWPPSIHTCINSMVHVCN